MVSGGSSTSLRTSAPSACWPFASSASPKHHTARRRFARNTWTRTRTSTPILVGPGHPLYAAVDERLNEQFGPLLGGIGVYVDEASEVSYRLHFFEASIRGQNSKGEHQTLHGELVAVREELSGPTTGTGRFSSSPPIACLTSRRIPSRLPRSRVQRGPAADFIKVTYQMELRSRCQEERRHFVDICRDYLTRSFDARVRAAQDRVMALRMREAPTGGGHRPAAGRE